VRCAPLLALASLAGCAANGHTLMVSATDPAASVYINGMRVGSGAPTPRTFDFKDTKRVFVQAAHPDYEPFLEAYTEDQIRRMIDSDTPLKLSLRTH
jgi:hypothetical protein